MLAVLAVAAGLSAAQEPPPGLSLEWEAPPGCPDAAAVRARVVALTGAEAAGKANLRARGSVRETDGRWTLDLELTGETGSGRRMLKAQRCEELAEAGALVVAIAVDPRAAGVVPAPPQEVGGTGSTGQMGDVVERTWSNEHVKEEEVRGAIGPRIAEVVDEAGFEETGSIDHVQADTWPKIGLRAAGGVSFARLLPGPSAAVSLTVSVSGRRWRAEVGGLYMPRVQGGTAAIGGLFQAGAVELRGCPVLRRGRIEVPLCAGLQIGAMEGKGRGTMLIQTSTERSPWLALTLGAALAWRPQRRVGLWLQADAIVALLRPAFATAEGTRIHETARVGGQVLAGIEVGLR
ncbi:MAG TPA: hypothetical protein VIK91_10510 [Nannocystis sp.]